MTEINIPFSAENIRKILSDNKGRTTRSQHYRVGDTFEIWDEGKQKLRKFVIVQAFRTRMGYIRDRYWKGEGCSSSKEFEISWCKLHPNENKNGFDPERIKWHYVFEPAENPGGPF